MPKPIQAANEKTISEARQRSRLTPRQQKFVQEFAADPSNGKAAAIRAGYAPGSAKVTASRLLQNTQIQSLLGNHFTDSQALISDILVNSLRRIDKIVSEGSNKDAVKAIGQGFNYARLAAGVLGLQVLPKHNDSLQTDTMTMDEAIETLERELGELKALRARQSFRAVGDDSAGGNEGASDESTGDAETEAA